jgi:DNA-directed RNA polymerase specialized sigma24 family protein
MLDLSTLEERCMSEIENDGFRDLTNAQFSLELLHRATWQGSQEAREAWQRCFSGILRGWLHRHPRKEEACRFDSEEHYVAQAFERFWKATACNQQLEFRTLAAALQYLRACLHGAILDTLRTYQRPGDASRYASGAPGEPSIDDVTGESGLWDILKGMLSNPREQRLAYLLFHCGLKPREIVHVCSPEWSSVPEISVLRHTIMERVLRHLDTLRWRLN